MNIYPEDFDPAYRIRIQQMQKAQSLQDGTFVFARGYDGFLGAVCGMAPAITLNLWLHLLPDTLPGGAFLAGGAGAAIGYVCGFTIDRRRRGKGPTNKITAREITLLQQGETDFLRLEYFGLLSKLVSMPPSQDMSAEESIRIAVRDIGSGIEKLPGQPAADLLLDAKTFQQEASCLLVKAAQESDPVVAASLQRQSVAQSHRGDAVSRNSTIARRNQILRSEMSQHIKMLTTMLSATTLDDSKDGYDFAELVKNIQQVASEAKSLTEAKQELAAALEERQQVRLSIRG
jgi:hypothetical protein